MMDLHCNKNGKKKYAITESRTQEIRTQEVSVLSNLRISGCELKDNCYVSFT